MQECHFGFKYNCSFDDSEERGGDAWVGRNKEDTAGQFSEVPCDRGDQPRFWHFASDGSEGFAVGGDVVPACAPDAVPSEDRSFAIGTGGDSIGKRLNIHPRVTPIGRQKYSL